MLTYMLAYRPDEFGLVPDDNGFVRCKNLLKAFHEEDGWRHIRQSHIDEMLMGEGRSLFVTEKDRIRSRERHWFLNVRNDLFVPGLLFTPARKRAHPVVMEKGLKASTGSFIILTPDREMAMRIGHRRDQHPVLLEISGALAQRKGVCIFPFGDLFLAPEIPARFISGPLPPKTLLEKEEKSTSKRQKARSEPKAQTPGSFVLDPQRDPDPLRKSKGKKQKGWKEAARKMRRRKK